MGVRRAAALLQRFVLVTGTFGRDDELAAQPAVQNLDMLKVGDTVV